MRYNVYLPDDLSNSYQLYKKQINLSAILQDALRQEISRIENSWVMLIQRTDELIEDIDQ